MWPGVGKPCLGPAPRKCGTKLVLPSRQACQGHLAEFCHAHNATWTLFLFRELKTVVTLWKKNKLKKEKKRKLLSLAKNIGLKGKYNENTTMVLTFNSRWLTDGADLESDSARTRQEGPAPRPCPSVLFLSLAASGAPVPLKLWKTLREAHCNPEQVHTSHGSMYL